jgi:glycosyltransferase involved in cell wall biosynthesis
MNVPEVMAQNEQVKPKVAILMGTFNGQEHLGQQLDSIAAQTYGNWQLWVSDDGSQDGTRALLEDYLGRWGAAKACIESGPGKGHAANFLSLTCSPRIHAQYYAYSDQDDIWLPDKLERALGWLSSVPVNVPAIYCSRTLLVDCDNRVIGSSPLFRKPPSFANALMQNIAGGNTMVLNHAARMILKQVGQDLNVVTHDWWAYLVVTACGGRVKYDAEPTVRYRQHGNNLVGSNADAKARLTRIKMLWDGRFRDLNDRHIQALASLLENMTPENARILARFEQARKAWLVPRLLAFLRMGLYRQTLVGNLGLIAATFFNRI